MSDLALEKILVLDDNPDYRKLIKKFIKKILPSVDVIEYDPVLEGIPSDDFNWHEIDILLLDYQLSIAGPTGLDILHQHYKKPEFPAAIMLTSQGNEEIAVRALKSGIYEYHTKQSLTKDRLKQSIIHAWEEKKSDRKKQQEITQHSRSFSKEVFYHSLEQAYSQEVRRALIVIKLDNIKELEQQIGLIGKDSLVNHIARNSFSVFKMGACNPNITRISDDAIAIQIDYPANLETLEFNLQGLCANLAKCTFKFSGKKYNYTFSVGALDLNLFSERAEKLIGIASLACKRARNNKNNSHYIWQETDDISGFDNQAHIVTPEEVATTSIIEPEKEAHDAIKIAEGVESETELKPTTSAKKAETAIRVEPEARLQAVKLKTAAKADEGKKIDSSLPSSVEPDVIEKPNKQSSVDKQGLSLNEKKEALIRRLMDEKKIIQTYQPVINMKVAEGKGVRDIFKTGLKSIVEDKEINNMLANISTLPITLQQTINQWALRQIFLNITESDPASCHYIFLFSINEAWFSDITLFNWLQKILSQTQQYNPGESIILNVPFDILMKHQKRAIPLINTLQKKHAFKTALSNIDSPDSLQDIFSSIPTKLLMLDVERIKDLNEFPEPESNNENNEQDEDSEQESVLQNLKANGIGIITFGIEDSALLMDAILAGTDYAIGGFVGEIQDNLIESGTIESFELI